MKTDFKKTEDASVWQKLEKKEGTVRFAVFSDLHLFDMPQRLELVLQSISNIGGIDGIFMVGDIVYMYKPDVVYPEVYRLFNDTLNKFDEFKDIPKIFSLGNHEYPQSSKDPVLTAEAQKVYIEATDFNLNKKCIKKTNGLNAVYEICTYTAVVSSHSAYSVAVTADEEIWLKEQLSEAMKKNPDKPVFYLQHRPIQNTVYASNEKVNSDEFITWIKKQKKIINFTAHAHYSLYDPRSIWQSEDGFTAVESSLLGGSYLALQGKTYERECIEDVSYILLVEIDKNEVVKIYKLDLYNGEYVSSPFVIDVNSNERLYTDERYKNINVPRFENGEKITVEEITSDSVTVCFTDSAVMEETVKNVSNDGFVHHYKIQATNKITGEVDCSVSLLGNFWTKNTPIERRVKLEHLKENTDYEIAVIPFSPLNECADKGGEALTLPVKSGR